jgi:hypothetical protein
MALGFRSKGIIEMVDVQVALIRESHQVLVTSLVNLKVNDGLDEARVVTVSELDFIDQLLNLIVHIYFVNKDLSRLAETAYNEF